MKKKLLVIGSSNMDLVCQIPSFPEPGETIGGGNFDTFLGGKGANQAVAALRSKLCEVLFVTRLGDDSFGNEFLTFFQNEGFDTSYTSQSPNTRNGCALILINQNGENCIALAAGANNTLTPKYLDSLNLPWNEIAMVLIQMEIPSDSILHIQSICKNNNTPLAVNLAPPSTFQPSFFLSIDYLIVNEHEIKAVLESFDLPIIPNHSSQLLSLHQKGVKNIVLTLGEQGLIAINSEANITQLPTQKVKVVDTTAAGDTFCGYFCASLVAGLTFIEALIIARNAATLSVTKLGAIPSIPVATT